jgi:hypothetical protein
MSLLLLFAKSGDIDLPVSDIDVYTSRTIRAIFTDEVVTDSRYYDVNNYTLTLIEGSGPVEIISVLSTNETATLELVLVTQPMTAGSTYQLEIEELANREGSTFGVFGQYIYRDTKSDSGLRSVPKHFDKRPTSLIATMITAIGVSDDLIGGSRNDTLTVESA